MLNSIVLFPGGGIADFGLSKPPKAVVDIDAQFLEAYRLNHGNETKRIKADLSKEKVESNIVQMDINGELDLQGNHPPCQGFCSAASGQTPRHFFLRSLFLKPVEYARILRPRFIYVENVTGILQEKNGNNRYIRWIQRDLQELGYRTAVWGANKHSRLNAIRFGGCQSRSRVVVVASRIGPVPPEPIGHAVPMTLRMAIGHLTEQEAIKDGLMPMSETFQTMINNCKPGGRLQPKGSYYRFEMDKPIPTLMTGPIIATSLKAVHPEKNRCLSVREFACCMGVPNYRFPISMSMQKRYEVIGQAVQPFLIKAVVDRLTGSD